MQPTKRLLVIAAIGICAMVTNTDAQENPYREDGWAKPPDGRRLGQMSAIDVDPAGNVWVLDRCGANSCTGSNIAPVVKFDPAGKYLTSFAAGLMVFPHGMHVDKDGNVWVTDADGKDGKGHQVFKFAPDGRALLTLGKAGVAGNAPTFSIARQRSPLARTVMFTSPTAMAANPTRASSNSRRTANSSKPGAKKARRPASSKLFTPSPPTLKDAFSSATAATAACRFSTRTATSSRSGNNSAARAACSSITMNCSTSLIISPILRAIPASNGAFTSAVLVTVRLPRCSPASAST
jgi:hypothetical protein